MTHIPSLPRYDRSRTYDWNYEHAPEPVDIAVPSTDEKFVFCGLPVDSPLGLPAVDGADKAEMPFTLPIRPSRKSPVMRAGYDTEFLTQEQSLISADRTAS